MYCYHVKYLPTFTYISSTWDIWTNIFYCTEFLRGENGLDGNFFQEMLVEKAEEVTDFFSLKILANADYPLVLGQQS